MSPETVEDTPTQSHAKIDIVTFNQLSSNSVSKLRQERDRLRFGGLRGRHSLLHQLDRSVWPVLFMILKLHGQLPEGCSHESTSDFEQFRQLLVKREDAVLEVLERQYPAQKSASIVDLCTKITWCIDPRYATNLEQYGKVKQLMQTYHPSEEEEKMIVQNWKSSWDAKVLGPFQVKSQLKATLFSQQHAANLEIF